MAMLGHVATASALTLLAGCFIPANAHAETLAVCVSKESGVVRIPISGAKCKRTERSVSWNSEGVQGPQGPAGPAGAAGGVGPAGPRGETGSSGGSGASGPAGPAGSDGAAGQNGATGATGPTGATGATGATGPIGPSNGYYRRAGVVQVTNAAPVIVVQFPTNNFTGDFVVSGTVKISNPQGGADSTISCHLVMGSESSDDSYLFLTPGVDLGGRLGTIPLIMGYSGKTDANISITCNVSGGPVNVVSSSITAIKVGTLN